MMLLARRNGKTIFGKRTHAMAKEIEQELLQ
jgi:hypothetical protein